MKKRKPRKAKVKPGTSPLDVAARHKLFIAAMIKNNWNQTKSAIDAGYSARTAAVTGNRLVNHPKILPELEKLRQKVTAQYDLTAENVVKELARLTFFDVGKCYDADGKPKKIHEIDEDTRRAIAGYKDGEIKAFSKPEAIGKAMNYLGMIKRANNIAIAQSAAAAEVSQTPPEKKNDLEIARRIAFLLSRAAGA